METTTYLNQKPSHCVFLHSVKLISAIDVFVENKRKLITVGVVSNH